MLLPVDSSSYSLSLLSAARSPLIESGCRAVLAPVVAPRQLPSNAASLDHPFTGPPHEERVAPLFLHGLRSLISSKFLADSTSSISKVLKVALLCS